jgi:hypothetical protein
MWTGRSEKGKTKWLTSNDEGLKLMKVQRNANDSGFHLAPSQWATVRRLTDGELRGE